MLQHSACVSRLRACCLAPITCPASQPLSHKSAQLFLPAAHLRPFHLLALPAAAASSAGMSCRSRAARWAGLSPPKRDATRRTARAATLLPSRPAATQRRLLTATGLTLARSGAEGQQPANQYRCIKLNYDRTLPTNGLNP